MATIKRSTAVEALYSNDPPPIKWGDVSAADQRYSVITTSTVTEANHMILVIAFALVSLVLVVSTFKVANATRRSLRPAKVLRAFFPTRLTGQSGWLGSRLLRLACSP